MPDIYKQSTVPDEFVKEKHHQFEALFNYATIGIVVTDHTGTIINFNKYAELQFGYNKIEAVGRPVDMLLPKNLHSSHQKHRTAFYQHPEPRRMGEGRDLYAVKKDGTLFPVEISLTHYSIDEEMYVIAFVIDISVRKRSEAMVSGLNADLEKKVEDRTIMLKETLSELEQSRKELNEALIAEKELSDLKYRFVTAASHEFRTPLSTILSSAFILGKYKSDEYEDKKEKHIQRIKNAVEGMKSILEDFLSLGKLEEGKIHVKLEEISSLDCIEELQSAINELEHLLKPGQRIVFSHSIKSNTLITDSHILKSIFINLVSNAIKFSGENTEINIFLSLTENEFSLSVKDSGIGIPVEDQVHLFDRFFRAGNAINIQGSGLGLHIIGKYLELLEGSIKIVSVINEGSTFLISFPQKRVALF